MDHVVGKIVQLTQQNLHNLLPGEKVLPLSEASEYVTKIKGIRLKNDGLGSLKQIADALWRKMEVEIERNGHSDLTLSLEGAARGIYEIIELNNIVE